MTPIPSICFFFFNDTATTEIYTLSLHDALPISGIIAAALYSDIRSDAAYPALVTRLLPAGFKGLVLAGMLASTRPLDRKSTRLNSSHGYISYAVFCLKKKNK